jgi:hypothetical protein
MNLRRMVAALAATAVATGATLLLAPTAAHGVTLPTPVSFWLTGLQSSACPLPLNGSIAFTPGTTLRLQKDPLLGPVSTERVTFKPAPNSTDPKSSKSYDLGSANVDVAFTRAGTYNLSWQQSTLGVLGTAQTGKLVINAKAQGCVVAVSVPTPSVTVPGAGTVTNPVNGIVGGVVGSVNGAVSPVNGALGPILGGANPGGLPDGTKNPPSGNPSPGASGSALNYHSNGPSVADRTVPHGYGGGSGAASNYVPAGLGGSIVAPGTNFAATGKTSGRSTAAAGPSGSGPKTVDVASSKSRSALDALPTLLVVLAVIALSGATAFYARTFLLDKPAAPAKLA